MCIRIFVLFAITIIAIFSISTAFHPNLNIKPFIVLSGSMRPNIKEGSIVFVNRNIKNFQVNDIITYINPNNPQEFITHRIISISNKDNRLVFETQGDTNNQKDDWFVYKESIFGKVIFTIPSLGYIVNFAQTKTGTILVIVLPLSIITCSQILVILKEIKKNKTKNATLTILFIFVPISILMFKPSLTFSFFNDFVTATGYQIQTGYWDLPKTFILNQESIENNLNFTINYFIENENNLNYVQLCYSYNLENIFNCPATQDFQSSTGLFNFWADKDGLYTFYTIAHTNNGYQEVISDLEDKKYMIRVDTESPTTNIDLSNLPENSWSGQNLINNDSFESAGTGSSQVDLEEKNVLQVIDNIYQIISLPQNISSNLTFLYRFISQDIVDYDRFIAQIRNTDNTVAANIISTGGTGDSGWHHILYPLNDFAGKTIKLWFELVNSDTSTIIKDSQIYLDDIKVNSLDQRLSQETNINFESQDTGSGILISPQEIGLTIGDNTLEYSSVDIAENSESSHNVNILVSPNIVLNKISLNTVELFNNTTTDITLNNWKLKNKTGETFPIINLTISPTSSAIIHTQGNISDKIYLLDSDNIIIDSTEYTGQYTNGEIWERSPDGIGTWKLSNSTNPTNLDLDTNIIYRPNTSKITFSAFNISSNFDYEILYTSGNETKGIFGSVNSETAVNNKIDRDFYLGTCSKNVCTSDLNIGSTLQVNLTSADSVLLTKTFTLFQ